MKHNRFTRKPDTCKERGSNSSKQTDEDEGYHVFDDTFNKEWLKEVMKSEDNCLIKKEWNSALHILLVLSAGALYDEMDKTFVLLSKEQMGLLNLRNHPMGRPRLIYGPAGSGKTLLIIAKILELIKTGDVDESTQILYMCENEAVQHYVRNEVEKKHPAFRNLATMALTED